MLAIPQEYISSLCEVKSMTNDPLAVGRIIKIDNEALEITSRDDERMPLLQYRTPVKIFVYNTKLPTRILVGIVYLSTENFARLEEVQPLQDFERRAAFRVNTNVSATMIALRSPEEQAKFDAILQKATPEEAEKMLAHSTLEVRVMDISLTGLRVQSPTPLPVGARYFVEFILLDSHMTFNLRVQRLIKMPNGEIQYGCIFFDYSERRMDALCKELFQLQRYEKNRRLNSALGV